ncbi:aldehyde dehydrogenase family protein [Vibrio coralliilyticus]|uniref:aldehyde dehydrogenase family protein n=1 Tax=Vibrio coralliilyticus TaxID=190893 RepID=UPI00156017E3|nr:aldehyde dehydrogenase family protein [Vibrio coralliilyticus]NRF12905.1 aldehyde dehydrogenase family protein [Vibrio coralliilyticus]
MSPYKQKYLNYINGQWCEPELGQYFLNTSPINTQFVCEIPESSIEDIDSAVSAARNAFKKFKMTSVTKRANLLLEIANRIENNLGMLAHIESYDNGKPIRETMLADLPLVVDHFRYFAGCLRAEEGSASRIDSFTMTYHLKEPIGVVGQIIPWNFPLLMAAWKLAPAIAAGCTVVLKPAEQTPVSILHMIELIEDLIPAGVINIVNGYGETAGSALASHPDINKLAFTGSTQIGHTVYQEAAKKMIPCTIELGGKSPNIFLEDILEVGEEYLDKCVEGVLLAFFNQGEVCTCPSRLLIQESIFDSFMAKVLRRASEIIQGNPMDMNTQVGSQVSEEQFDRILNYIELGKQEGAEVLLGGNGVKDNGYFVEPTILKGNNTMRIFQEEIFGPVISVTTFENIDEALQIANDSMYGLGAGVWTKNANHIHFLSDNIEAGRIWVNCYHAYPAHAAFGGYKQSGIGRETHKMMLSHYQQTKNIIISHSDSPLGLF